jgi:hypothetical protein
MRMTGRVLAAAGAAALIMIVPVSAAFAADATGCSGSVESRLADGTKLDAASAPGSGGTATDPLVIDPAGSVAWEGSTSAVITGGTWTVRVGGVPVMSGTADNTEGATSASGVVDLANALAPVQWILQTNALIPVDGELTGTGGTCSGSGYVAGTGGGTFTSPVFLAGAGFTTLGVILALGMIAATKASALTAAAHAASAANAADAAGGAS